MEKSLNPKRQFQLPRISRRLLWVGLGFLTLVINYILSFNPYFTEVVYARGIFWLFRWVWDYTLGLLPVPLLYVLILGLIAWQGLRLWCRRHQPVKQSWGSRLRRSLLSIAAFWGAFIFFFFFLWGFNYHRQPLADRIEMRVDSLDDASVKAEFLRASQALVQANMALYRAPEQALQMEALPADLEHYMRTQLVATLQQLDYPTPGRVRARTVFPMGFMMQMGASGVYIPFIGEGHVDAAMPAVSQPFILAHEMAHGYGFGDEGTCNFLAYLSCQRSEHPAIRYAGAFSYWLHPAIMYRERDSIQYQLQVDSLPAGVHADLRAIEAVYERYPGFFPRFSKAFYDWYLRTQGIEAGIHSYSQVVAWVHAWHKWPGRSHYGP